MSVIPVGMHKDFAPRFWAKVNLSGPLPPHRPELGECYIWTAGKNRHGYGRFGIWYNGRTYAELAHRVAFFLVEQRWPQPFALHHCDNPACVRRSHLFEGDQQANIADMRAKGRARTGVSRGVDHGQARLTENAVRAIRAAVASGELQRVVAERFGVSQVMVSQIARRASWSHLD